MQVVFCHSILSKHFFSHLGCIFWNLNSQKNHTRLNIYMIWLIHILVLDIFLGHSWVPWTSQILSEHWISLIFFLKHITQIMWWYIPATRTPLTVVRSNTEFVEGKFLQPRILWWEYIIIYVYFKQITRLSSNICWALTHHSAESFLLVPRKVKTLCNPA